MEFSGVEIAATTNGQLIGDGGPGVVLTDTRALVPGCWFLAIVGDRFDGHRFLQAAIDAGAQGVICSELPEGWSHPAVVVADTTIALQDLGRTARERLEGPVIGLTGSSGKTTTRALIACALSPLGKIHQTVGNLNNHLGVPMSLLAAPVDAAASVIEMGTSSPGEIEFLAELATPDIRLVINVGPAHLEELGGLEGVAVEKGTMFQTARSSDLLVVNLDDPRVISQVPEGARIVTYGKQDGAVVRLLSAVTDPGTLSVQAEYMTPGGLVRLRLPAPGEHIAHNAGAAIAIAIAMGVRPDEAARGLETYQPVGMRLRAETLPSGAIALNDSYNANPQSMLASLRVLAGMPGRTVAVLGDMLELGPSEQAYHLQVVRQASELAIDQLVLVGERMTASTESATVPCFAASSHDAASEFLHDFLRPGDCVLFKGSRGARVEAVLTPLREGTA